MSIVSFLFYLRAGDTMYVEQNNVKYEIIEISDKTKVRFNLFVENGSFTPNHWHRAIEIIYVLEGTYTICINDKSYLVQSNNCIVIDANVIHSVKSTQFGRYILLQIPLELIEDYLPNVYQLKFFFNEQDSTANKNRHIKYIKHILSKMLQIKKSQRDGFLLYFHQLLFKLIYILYANFCNKVYQSYINIKKREIARLNKILAYIMQNYNKNISLDEIAKVATLQPKYFCRFFKKYLGITFKEYQNELRLSYIYHDLLTTDNTVNDILEEHGFTNYKLFIRLFKNHFNDTPINIRKKLAKNNIEILAHN